MPRPARVKKNVIKDVLIRGKVRTNKSSLPLTFKLVSSVTQIKFVQLVNIK